MEWKGKFCHQRIKVNFQFCKYISDTLSSITSFQVTTTTHDLIFLTGNESIPLYQLLVTESCPAVAQRLQPTMTVGEGCVMWGLWGNTFGLSLPQSSGGEGVKLSRNVGGEKGPGQLLATQLDDGWMTGCCVSSLLGVHISVGS